MVEMTATIDGAASAEINKALGVFSEALGEHSAKAPRIVALGVCDSFHAKTKKAKRKKARQDWSAEPIKPTGFKTFNKNGLNYTVPWPSPYVTSGHGKSNGLIIHRYTFTTRKGTEGAKSFPVGAYSMLRHTKSGKIVTDKSGEMRQIKEIHALNMQSGLAANSWKWVKRGIGKGGADPIYRRRKNDVRDPKSSVSGSSSSRNGATMAEGWAEIHNHLDFISSAISDAAVNEAMRAAAAKIFYKTAVAQRMTPQEAAKYARDQMADLAKQNASKS